MLRSFPWSETSASDSSSCFEGSGGLIIPLPRVIPEFGSPYGEQLFSPKGWPPHWRPEPGETLAAALDRDINGDRFLRGITPLTSGGRPVPPLDGRRPADLTLARWEKEYPYKVLDPWGKPVSLDYHRDRVHLRLVVEMIARWESGDLVMKARRMDVPTSPLEVVERGLVRNHFMVLRPHAPGGGWFRPEKWHESEPPPGLPWYCELTLWPAEAIEAAEAKRKSIWVSARKTCSTALRL
jgi:hypothetical protein